MRSRKIGLLDLRAKATCNVIYPVTLLTPTRIWVIKALPSLINKLSQKIIHHLVRHMFRRNVLIEIQSTIRQI